MVPQWCRKYVGLSTEQKGGQYIKRGSFFFYSRGTRRWWIATAERSMDSLSITGYGREAVEYALILQAPRDSVKHEPPSHGYAVCHGINPFFLHITYPYVAGYLRPERRAKAGRTRAEAPFDDNSSLCRPRARDPQDFFQLSVSILLPFSHCLGPYSPKYLVGLLDRRRSVLRFCKTQ